MGDNSLLLLAVKRSMNLGKGALQGGNNFQSLYGISSLEEAEVECQYMNDYIDILVDECMAKIPASLGHFRTNILNALTEAKEFESYNWGDDSNLFCDTFYENNVGKLSLFVYLFAPNDQDVVKCETMSVDLQFRLADIAVTITKMKKRLFGRTKKWTEIRYIKPAVKFVDYINALAIVIAPLLQTNVKTPTGLQAELTSQANQIPNTIPSDDARRTVYDPMNKMNVVVTDEAVLKLIPGRWEYVSSDMVQAQQENSQKYWEFDE